MNNIDNLTSQQKEQLNILESKLFLNSRNFTETSKIMQEIILLFPNNYDLGTYIKNLYFLES